MSVVRFGVFAFCCTAISLSLINLPKANGTVLKQQDFELNLIHFNDFHARFEETSRTSTRCIPGGEPCIGGFPRLYTIIKELKTDYPDGVVLDAGDSFQGTLWYNLLRWNVTQYFMNMLPVDAITLGNHEFDHGVKGVVPYMKALNAPIIVANMDDSEEPEIQNLYQNSIVIERKGRKIGIIGLIAKNTDQLANTGKLKFMDEIETVNKEADKMASYGVDIIIVLSHCGLSIDRLIAKEMLKKIDIIVGGHSHSLLYSGTPPSGERPEDTYPVRVNDSIGNQVLIVQASAFTKYIGNITVFFDAQGKITSWDGNAIYLENSIKQDPQILELMKPFQEEVSALGRRVIGETKVHLRRSDCAFGECNIGNFVADAFIESLVDEAEEGHWTFAPACLINQGGLRTDIMIGNITLEDLVASQPFENTIHTFDIKGKHILEALQYAVNETERFYFRMVQVSGIKVKFDLKKPIGSRVVRAEIRCGNCSVPTYSPIEEETMYRFATSSFVANGGDGFTMLSENKQNVKIWKRDIDVLEENIKKDSPLWRHAIERRITFV